MICSPDINGFPAKSFHQHRKQKKVAGCEIQYLRWIRQQFRLRFENYPHQICKGMFSRGLITTHISLIIVHHFSKRSIWVIPRSSENCDHNNPSVFHQLRLLRRQVQTLPLNRSDRCAYVIKRSNHLADIFFRHKILCKIPRHDSRMLADATTLYATNTVSFFVRNPSKNML